MTSRNKNKLFAYKPKQKMTTSPAGTKIFTLAVIHLDETNKEITNNRSDGFKLSEACSVVNEINNKKRNKRCRLRSPSLMLCLRAPRVTRRSKSSCFLFLQGLESYI
ncbi:hypothetical protein XENORESO_017252 [Xenotaenia resolanae]|uniref:Uncharacterized protein n=1 Tax=Xenotaenia resolanae TaxID=208358 RepID=A0ABV0WJ09_9TELE